MLEPLAGPFPGPVAEIELAMSLDQQVQIRLRHLERAGDFAPGKPEGAILGRVRDELGLKGSG